MQLAMIWIQALLIVTFFSKPEQLTYKLLFFSPRALDVYIFEFIYLFIQNTSTTTTTNLHPVK